MKNFWYSLLKAYVKISLHFYFGKIEANGLENIPKNGAVLFLPNHQKALMDVLLIVVDCNRKPYFLARSDIFRKKALREFFAFLRMIPIYRMRDGRKSLANNEVVFNQCAQLFKKEEAIVIFPEANHNLRRRVRPLSKGFTRFVFNFMDGNPNGEILLVPVGLNYKEKGRFPDRVALYYGKPIASSKFYDAHNANESATALKLAVSEELKKLTTHIEYESNYEAIEEALINQKVDFLNPKEVNNAIQHLDFNTSSSSTIKKGLNFFDLLFKTLNILWLLPWYLLVKPKVWEPEFLSTMRFAYALIVYPFYLLILGAALFIFADTLLAIVVITAIFIFNFLYVGTR